MKIKSGDTVLIRAGKDKGKKGTVLKAFPKLDRVLVEGINMVKKHVKPRGNIKGTTIEKSLPMHVSNVALVDEKTGKTGRVGYTINDGKKTRIVK